MLSGLEIVTFPTNLDVTLKDKNYASPEVNPPPFIKILASELVCDS